MPFPHFEDEIVPFLCFFAGKNKLLSHDMEDCLTLE